MISRIIDNGIGKVKVTRQGNDIACLSFGGLAADDNNGRINIRCGEERMILLRPLIIVRHSRQDIYLMVLDFR
mgnify:CR=1 FL=1